MRVVLHREKEKEQNSCHCRKHRPNNQRLQPFRFAWRKKSDKTRTDTPSSSAQTRPTSSVKLSSSCSNGRRVQALDERTSDQHQPRAGQRRRSYEDRVTTMKPRSTQFGVRENTASSRRHAPRLAVDSLSSMSETLPGGLQYRRPTRLLASLANEPDKSIIATPLEAATGGEPGDSAETFSSPASVITAKESRQVTVAPEPFVSADEAAQFLSIKRRYLLELSRRGIAGSYALGTGSKRKVWVFRLSELATSVVRSETSIPKPPKPCTIESGSPR